MIRSVHNYPISQLFDTESNVVYAVPKYQREYTWKNEEWEALFDDIMDNHEGYFLGSIICINQSMDALASQTLEVVDGQQRLTTLSLLFAALYGWLRERDQLLDEDQRADLLNLKRTMVHKRSPKELRVVPQIQNSNRRDYEYVLGRCGVLESTDATSHVTQRRIFRAYQYFLDRLNRLADGETLEGLERVLAFREKVSQATIVKIEVANHADAYVLFESLNNRGVPLTAVDLIKNKLLAQLERVEANNTDEHFQKWTRIINFLGDDYSVQERFFRQYYNAFRDQLRIDRIPLARKSNLMTIYDSLITKDPKYFLRDVVEASSIYAQMIFRNGNDGSLAVDRPLRNLERIQGVPAYVLMLHLLRRRERYGLTDSHLHQIIDELVKFFVRRNLTNTPPTYDLDRLFMETIDSLLGKEGEEVAQVIHAALVSASAPEDVFRQALSGPIYENNANATRFILCALAEASMTRESHLDLWQRQGKQYIWSIEHIFPQGDSIPDDWVEMMASGDRQRARDIQEEFVHMLGNLTISGYNSSLGNKGFHEKRTRVDKDGRPLGYNNHLSLNTELATATEWSVERIEARTRRLVDKALEMFRFD